MKKILIPIALLLGLQAMAQHWKPLDRNIWLGPGELLFVPGNSDHMSAPGILKSLHSGRERRLPPPPREDTFSSGFSMGVQAAEGELFYLHASLMAPPNPEKDKKKPFKLEIFQFDKASWRWETEPWGVLISPRVMKPVLVSKDRVLGITAWADGFVKDGKGYPFAAFRRSQNGVFSIDFYQDCGLEKPAIKGMVGWNYPSLAQLWMDCQIASSGDQKVIGTGYGLYWVFNAKGSLKRVIRLFEGLNEEALQKGELWNEAVLGMQPRSDGDLLVSAFGEGTLDRVYRLLSTTAGSASGKEYSERRRKALDMAMSSSSRVDWYIIDIDTGKVNLAPPPVGFPEQLKNSDAIHNFNWAFKPNGNLLMYSEKEMLKNDPAASSLKGKKK